MPDRKIESFSKLTTIFCPGNCSWICRRKVVDAGPESSGVWADRHVEEELVAAFLPDDQAGFAGGLAIDQDFLRCHGARLGDIAVTDGNAFDGSGAIDDQRFADREHQFPR